MQKGKVKWFNADKGFGFINTDNKDDGDIFVHYSQINAEGYRTLKEGECVEFELAEDVKGKQAHNVSAVEETNPE